MKRFCSIHPYFEIPEENLALFKQKCQAFIDKTTHEKGCLFYEFTFDGNIAYCREGYDSAEAVLYHLDNVGALLNETLKIAELKRLEIHGPEEDIEKLRGPLSALSPAFFTLL